VFFAVLERNSVSKLQERFRGYSAARSWQHGESSRSVGSPWAGFERWRVSIVNSTFDLIFEPFVDRPPLFALIVFAFVTAFVLLLAYRFVPNRRAMRRAGNLFQAHLLEVRLFQDQFDVVWRGSGKLLRATVSYLGWALLPFLIVAIPIALLVAQMELRFGSRPFLPAESALLLVRVDDPTVVDRISLQLPEGVVETAPLVRSPAERKVVARLQTRLVGRSEILVNNGAASVSKEIVTGVGLERISTRRFRGSLLHRLIDPGEPELPRTSAVSSISILYPSRPLVLGPLEVNWLAVYSVLTLVAAIVLSPFLGAGS